MSECKICVRMIVLKLISEESVTDFYVITTANIDRLTENLV